MPIRSNKFFKPFEYATSYSWNGDCSKRIDLSERWELAKRHNLDRKAIVQARLSEPEVKEEGVMSPEAKAACLERRLPKMDKP